MIFEWDDAKRVANLRKHAIDFADAAEFFRGPTVTNEDSRFVYGERHETTNYYVRVFD